MSVDDPAERRVTRLYGAEAPAADQRGALTDGAVPVAVYGLGKMGLPLAAVYADVTGNVTGVDVDETVVETVERGESHVGREPGLADLVGETVEAGAFRATTDAVGAAADAAVHVVIVPTPIHEDGEPDLSMLRAAVEAIGRGLSPGDLVVIECTVPPGTSRELVLPVLLEESGLDRGEFGVAFCPERTSSGRAIEDIRGAYPKVVGGVDREATRAAALIYEAINERGVLEVSDATTAEAVKVFEGVYRDVNIALANELARFTDELGIDVMEAIETANTQPFCDIHTPGAGVGGHCIPYYPYFLIRGFETTTPLLETARAVNDGMPAFTVEKLAEGLAAEGRDLEGATVVVLGVTYRPGVAETAATPAGPIIEGLAERGAEVLAADPVLDAEAIAAFGAEPVAVGDLLDADLDGAVMVTPHEEFDAIDWPSLGGPAGLVVVDGRQALDLSGTNHRVYTIGSG